MSTMFLLALGLLQTLPAPALENDYVRIIGNISGL